MGIEKGAGEVRLDDFSIAALGPNTFVLRSARVEVDDDDWGEIPVEEAQAHLEEADDFAIVVLRTEIEAAEPVAGLMLEAAAEGQRNLSFGKTYLVPSKEKANPGYSRYCMPDPLPVAVHPVIWSYAWHPPKDRDTGEPLPGGVRLLPLQVVGNFATKRGRIVAVPGRYDLREEALAIGPCSARRRVQVPANATKLRLQGPGAVRARVSIGGHALVRREDGTGVHLLVPGTAGAVDLEIRWESGFLPLERATWLTG